MKILIIDATLAYPSESAKIGAFAGIEGIDLEVLAGHIHHNGLRLTRWTAPPLAQGVRIRVGKIFGKFPNRTLLATGLVAALRHHPDVIVAYSDWDHLLTLQIALYKAVFSPKSKLIMQGWENQTRSAKSFPQANIWLYRLDQLLSKLSFALADGVAARSPEAAKVVAELGYDKPVKVIAYGVDVELFQPRDKPSGGLFTVGYVGRLAAAKGVDDLLRALAGLDGIQALIIGDGTEKKALKLLAEELAVKVTFLGAVDQQKLPDSMAQMDLLVLPSRTTPRWAEQFGRVLAEAMAMGIPALGSDSGAIPWVINDPQMIFPEGDVQGMREIIIRLQTDLPRRQKIAAQQQEMARQQFNWSGHAQATIEFGQELCQR